MLTWSVVTKRLSYLVLLLAHVHLRLLIMSDLFLSSLVDLGQNHRVEERKPITTTATTIADIVAAAATTIGVTTNVAIAVSVVTTTTAAAL